MPAELPPRVAELIEDLKLVEDRQDIDRLRRPI